MSEQKTPMNKDWQGRPICDKCNLGIHFYPPSPDCEIKTTAPPMFAWDAKCGCPEVRGIFVSENESPWSAWERKR